MAKKLKYLIVHCSDTPKGRTVTKQNIIDWHTKPKPKGRGWRVPGYSELIEVDGKLTNITPYNDNNIVEANEITNGAFGINSVSRHICVVGGRTSDNKNTLLNFISAPQADTLHTYLAMQVALHPNIKIAGHYHFSEYKTCPNFDVEAFLLSKGFSPKNIYTNDKKNPFDIIVK